MNFRDVFAHSGSTSNRDFLISTEDILVKFLHFLEFWIQKDTPKNLIIFIIKALGRITKKVDDEDDDNKENEKLQVERQDMFDRLNATRIFIVLIWDEKKDDTGYLYSLFKFMISLLEGGNATVQKTLHSFFITNSGSEKFFRKVNDLILREISNINRNAKNLEDSNKIHRIGMKLMRLLQLFCEGHNLDLQNYLRN